MARPPRIANWLRWEQSTVYFITFCVEKRKHVLANDEAWKACLLTFARLYKWRLLAAIAMPDHLHILTAPQDREASVSAFSKWFKRWFNERYWATQPERQNCRPSVSDGSTRPPPAPWWNWQEGCFDRLLRHDESLSDKWNYLRENPVRAGLVANSDDWPYQFAFNSDDAKL